MYFTDVWKWLDGKKTKLAVLFYLFQDYIVPIWFENGTPDVLDKILQSFAAIFMFIGIGHPVAKVGVNILKELPKNDKQEE